MAKLIQTLATDAEQFAAQELPELRDLPGYFHSLVARLEAELPHLAERSLEDVLAAIAPAGAPEQPAQAVQHEPAAPAAPAAPAPVPVPAAALPAQPDAAVGQPPAGSVAPSESAGTAAGGAPSEAAGVATDPFLPAAEKPETRAARLRREADEAEAEEIQAEASAGTAAGAESGARVEANGQPQPPQSSTA